MRNIVTDVTGGHYVGVSLVMTKLHYKIITRNRKVLYLCYILSDPDPGGKNRSLYCGKYHLYVCFAIITLHFV